MEKKSYRDTVMGESSNGQRLQDDYEDEEGNTSDDDLIEEGDGITWFAMDMTKWRRLKPCGLGGTASSSKLVWRTIDY